MKNKKSIYNKPVQSVSTEHSKTDEFMDDYKGQYSRRTSNIYTGDQVIMTNQYDVSDEFKGVIWTVTGGPKFENGKQVVQLHGYEGWYPVDGLRVVG